MVIRTENEDHNIFTVGTTTTKHHDMSIWYHGWLSSPQHDQPYIGTVPEFEGVMAPLLSLMTKFALLSLA
jgi:hypothetical protein